MKLLMEQEEWEDEDMDESEEEEVKVSALRPSAFASTVAAMLKEAEEKKGGDVVAAEKAEVEVEEEL